MQEAKIVIFEDNDDIRRLMKRNFEPENTGAEYDFSVIGEAETMNDARQLIEDMDKDQVDVAVVDGNLTPGESKSTEGLEIVSILRSKLPELAIIGYSASSTEYGADIQIRKTEGFRPIVDYIKNL